MKAIRNSIGQRFARLDNLRILLYAAVLVVLLATASRASDPTGIYGFVDRVVFEPSDEAQERIQIWGGFALAKRENRNDYHEAERGYLYFKLRPGEEAVCKKEWAGSEIYRWHATDRGVRITLRAAGTQTAEGRRESGRTRRAPEISGHHQDSEAGLRTDYSTRKTDGRDFRLQGVVAAKDAPKAGNK
jgi:hypothetical protein